ncbi:hypothetical protein HAZT_HAZT009808 [Hyalella azteca]|uniref:Ig-like domain-containing protein n=1 Tax=Hyalella azteca TaxID=294128 RepID=A0A6A0HAV8_HYAAZ|nr:hypothetical protein HAZT_HAZT009808 [Hyalella azteca]
MSAAVRLQVLTLVQASNVVKLALAIDFSCCAATPCPWLGALAPLLYSGQVVIYSNQVVVIYSGQVVIYSGQVVIYSGQVVIYSGQVDGTLEVSDVRRDQDQGSYSCTAYDRQGQSDSQETFLQVVVPPEVLPFDFSGVHGEGERVGASCILSKGDPPIKIRWTKDRVPLENLNLPNIILIESIEFSSMLMITSLTAEHSGRYACSASNGVTEARHEADLFVHGTGGTITITIGLSCTSGCWW